MSSNIQPNADNRVAKNHTTAAATLAARESTRAAPSIESSLRQVMAARRHAAPSRTNTNTAGGIARSAIASQPSKVSEEELFAAGVHLRLASKSASLGDKFISQVESSLSSMTQSRGSANVYKAADRALRQIERSGDISSADYREIKAFAFGKAQLDQDRTEIAWTDFKDSPIKTGLGDNTPQSSANVESALQRFESNTPATELEMAIFKVKEAFNSLLVSLVRNQSSDHHSSGTRASSKAGNSHNLTKSHGSQAGFTISASHDSKAIDAPNGFLWKPVSDSDGKLAILLPPTLTSKTIGCRILAPDGSQVLATGRDGGVGNGDRQHYRFNAAGSSFPAGSIVEIMLRDGTTIRIKIEDTGARLEGR